MRVIFYISALKDEVKVQEKKLSWSCPHDKAKTPSPLNAEHNGHIPLGLSDLALPTPPTRALPRIALRRFLLRRGRGALSAFTLPTPPTRRRASQYAVSFSSHQKRRGQRRQSAGPPLLARIAQ